MGQGNVIDLFDSKRYRRRYDARLFGRIQGITGALIANGRLYLEIVVGGSGLPPNMLKTILCRVTDPAAGYAGTAEVHEVRQRVPGTDAEHFGVATGPLDPPFPDGLELSAQAAVALTGATGATREQPLQPIIQHAEPQR